MFGYIRPRIDELKVRQEAEYRAAYCGLCRCLGKRYGLTARFLVNYDITFACLLISGHGEQQSCTRQFCPANPLKKKACRPVTPATEYCADLCVILGAAALRDYVKTQLSGERVIAVIGMMKDKAVEVCARLYADTFDGAVATQIDYPRALPAPALSDLEFEILRAFDRNVDPALAPGDYSPELIWPWQ